MARTTEHPDTGPVRDAGAASPFAGGGVSPDRTPRPGSRPAGGRPSSRLGPGARKLWLLLHLLTAGAWIGIDVVVAVLVGVGRLGGNPAVQALAYQALGTFIVWPMLTSGLGCLLTGLILGWGTRWRLLRYWWVAVKLALNIILCTLIVTVLRPGMPQVRAHGAALSAGTPTILDVNSLMFPPAVSLTALSLATVLAVYKPWGQIRPRGKRNSSARGSI
jgi:hypothetical protein